jgi:hypothetical protein
VSIKLECVLSFLCSALANVSLSLGTVNLCPYDLSLSKISELTKPPYHLTDNILSLAIKHIQAGYSLMLPLDNHSFTLEKTLLFYAVIFLKL